MTLLNIAKNAKVTFSSTSQWSTDKDSREILTGEHNLDFSFHTAKEHNPWVELDLGASYVLHNIVVFNRKKCCQDKAYTLQVEISDDKINYELIHKGFIPFKEKIEFNLASLKTARYVKLSIEGFNYFHLSKIEIFIDESKNSGAISDKQPIPDKLKYNTLFLSFGENCLTDNILDRNNLKNFTTPYSHGRSNVEYILKIEKDNFKNFLNIDAWVYKTTREGINAPVLYADTELHNKYEHTQGFELTHHDIISDKELQKTMTRRCERLLNLKDNRILIFYHHRLCVGSSEELLIADLLELKKIYQKRGNEVDIIMFQQIIINNTEDRKVFYQLKNGIHIYNFYTLNPWSGDDLNLFWAKCDNDLIDIMINSVKSLIKS